jgi:hypothetical protein
MRKILCIICFLVFALLQVFSTESALRGMNGISANGNNFIPDFWADTLMVNPAFATELKAKWGLHLNNSLRLGIHGTGNDVANKVVTDVNLATGVDPMVLINFSNFVFGIGGAANFGFLYNDTNGNVSISPYVNAGAEALFAFNIKDAFRFGIDAKFVANLDGSLTLRGVVTPGIIFSFKKNMLSLSAPIHLAYVNNEDLNGKFRFGIIFVDDLLISDKFTIRIPARADVKLYTTPSTCHVTVPFSAGISLIGKVNDPLLFFAGVDIGTSFGTASVTVDDNDKETVQANEENYFGFTLAPTLNAGVEAKVLSWFTLRTGLSHYFCRNEYQHYDETDLTDEYWENKFTFIGGVTWTAGCTFIVGKNVRIDLAADLQNLEAAFSSKNHAVTGYDYDNNFKVLLTAAVSVFSSKPAEKK